MKDDNSTACLQFRSNIESGADKMFRSRGKFTRFVTMRNAIDTIDEVSGCSRLIAYLGCGQTEIPNFNVVIAVQKDVDRLTISHS